MYDDMGGNNDRFVVNRVQTSALAWVLKRYPNSPGALVRHENEIYVLR